MDEHGGLQVNILDLYKVSTPMMVANSGGDKPHKRSNKNHSNRGLNVSICNLRLLAFSINPNLMRDQFLNV
jgi:hypothetical protein